MPKTFREESSNDTPPHVGISHYDTEAPYIQCPMPGSMRLLRVSDKSGYWSLCSGLRAGAGSDVMTM